MPPIPIVPLRLTPPDTLLANLLAGLSPVAPRCVPLADARGLVLAEALVAAAPVPAQPVAAREGWGVVAAETQGASAFSPLPLPAAPPWLRPGDALPPGVDALLDAFDLDGGGPFAQAMREATPGDGVRLAGAEIGGGTILRVVGERLGARDLPALVAMGVESVAVRVPLLGLRHGDPAIAALIAAWARAEGADCVAWEPGVAADLLLLDGAAPAGATLGMGARPGMAAGIGLVEGVPCVMLPAWPEDALAAWLLLGLPAVRLLAGAVAPRMRQVRLGRKLASTVGLAELALLAIGGDGVATPLSIGALPLAALARADGVLVVPPGAEGYEAGTVIDALPLP